MSLVQNYAFLTGCLRSAFFVWLISFGQRRSSSRPIPKKKESRVVGPGWVGNDTHMGMARRFFVQKTKGKETDSSVV
jgi:hypothetical protein